MFSSRLRQNLSKNRLATAVDARRAAGQPIVDLTLSNPTRAGFEYPPHLLDALKDPAAFEYRPEPFGLPAARQAISAELARRRQDLPAERIVLTASTSEAYALLFKLLCDPGDVVLAPRPSYPLVEHLANLEGVMLEQYRLEFHGRWNVDVPAITERLEQGASSRVRAIVLITPNNPTGSVVSADELRRLSAVASAHDVAIISDEVFADYGMTGPAPPSALAIADGLVFSLGGLSKSAALPQMKLAWIGVSGTEALVTTALERLDVICDTYLSVSTPVQLAAGAFLEGGRGLREQVRRRLRENLDGLVKLAGAHPACTVLPVEAGWYAVVQVPAVRSEEAIVLDLLRETGILVHPGYFFDFEKEAFLVLSLLPATDLFASATATMLRHVAAH